jgi:hypothetical protein
MTRQPTLDATCGECAEASDCAGKPCVLGRCAACAADGDCGSGLVCRWLDPFDALQRGCVPRTTSPLPRGALCESDSDCEGSLPCSAGEGRAKRCGKACGKEDDCGPDHLCVAPGARTVSNSPARFATMPRWNELAGRIATCWPRVFHQKPCEIHQQCTLELFTSGLTCCDGVCTGSAVDLATGMCPSPDQRI